MSVFDALVTFQPEGTPADALWSEAVYGVSEMAGAAAAGTGWDA
jgi:hypothetical protein